MALLASLGHAQSVVKPEDEYKKLIRVSEDIQPLGENPFGEQISVYNGSLSFEQTDVSLVGNGPLLQLSRSYHLREAKESESIDGAFSDWDIEIPRITTMTANQANVTGWQINQSNSNARCTLFGPPPTVAAQQGGADWEPMTWWTGYQLVIPGSGSQDLLKRTGENTLSPNMGGVAFPIVTRQNWMISCGVQTDDGVSGEGFVAVAPDGTKYTFNHLVYRWAPNMNRPIGSGPMTLQSFSVQPMAAIDDFLRRRQASMLVTRVEDRFGNFLTYSYDGANLIAITASDGRALNLAYVPGTSRISTATLQSSSGARTWSYQYGTDIYHVLNRVTLPDNTSWSFAMADFLASDMDPAGGTCSTAALLSTNTWTGSITHPSGLVGSFQVKGMIHGRSYVPRSCMGTGNDTPDSTALIPRVYYQLTLMQKTFSGAGVPAETWSYSYSPANESWLQDCAGGCVATVWTDVVNPIGQATRYTFSNRFDATEGQLVSTDFYSGAVGTALLRSEDSNYAGIPPATEAWPWPWPKRYGNVLQSRMNQAQVELYAPQTLRTITQDGDSYTWQAESFNEFAQVTQTKRFSSITGQGAVQEQTSYLNDLPHWALGLPLQTDNLTTGETVSQNVYDLTNVTLAERWRFGQKLTSYTFNGAGQLASFTDGNAKTTSLGNYKRGIPQTIGYPDGTSQSLVVDDFGQIASITDQAGHTTSYGYDAVGRLTGITYPAGDEVTWLAKTFAYDFVTASERGLSANHWRRTTTTGSAKAVTYFDALLRPVLGDSAIGGAVQASTLTTYDPKGQKTFVSYPSATALSFTMTPGTAGITGSASSYDALGRLTQTRQDSELGVLTTGTAYLSGARQQVTDSKGNVTTSSYQVFDQPSYEAVIKVQAPAGITQSIARDLYGNPLSITQSGLYGTESNSVTKTLTYDSYHRLCRTTEPESGSEVMGYDSANNLAWSVSGATLSNDGSCHPELAQSAGVIKRTYDAMNRLTAILPPSGTQSTSYGYDAVGRMTSASSGISAWSATYNFRGLLTGESLQLTGQNAWGIGYAHDAYGSVSLIHYPDGENVSYAPDALGRATQVGSYASGLTYFSDGEVKDFVYGNGAVYAAEKNTRQLVSNFSYGQGATPLISEDYAYDANGNITTVADLANGPRNKSFGYDALNRLTSATAAGLWGTQSYTYDALNNLRTLQTGSQVSTYHYDTTNKLTSISNGATTLTSYLYDNRGNVTGKNATALVFDQKNQLTRVMGIGDYAYDAAGRRVMKTPAGGGAPVYYFYNQAGQLLYQANPGTGKATNLVYLGRKLMARNESLHLVAPGAVSFDANPNNGSYTVSWGAVPGATSYLLQESANGGGWTTVYSGTASSVALSGRAGGSYVYQVEGCVGATCGGWTSSATLGVRPALPAVTVPTGTINGSYTVSWTAPASATGYDVQEQVNGGGWTTIASSTAATAISRPGTSSGSYTYQVSAKNAYGSRGWAASGAVTVDTTYGVVPTAPASLTVPASSSTGGATLSWSASSLTTSYTLQQSNTGGASWSAAYTGSGTNAALSGLADGSYLYRVQACNTYGCSTWTAGSATLVVTHPPTTAPTVNTPASSASGSYTVSWGAVGTATSYTLQEQINGGTWTTIQTSSATSKAISGKGNGTYGYKVQACNVGGCGPWSATGSTTVLLPPVAPASITVPATSSGSIAVSWTASATATSYTLQQRLGTGSWGTVYTGAATSSTRTVTVSGSYTYQVQACNASGCSAYRASTAVAVTIPPATAPALSVPATNNTGSYAVSWGGVSGATSYTLQEQVNGGGWATMQASGATSWNTSGKGSGTYGYQVQACNAGGCGPWSSTSSITVTVIPATPGTPSTSVSGPSYKPVVSVSWGAVSGATSYQLEETHPQDGVSIVYNGSATSWSQLIFATGTVQFRVKACNSAGCSAFSNYSSVVLNSGL
ncbi:hypothetical protein RHOFW104T7_06615 [Rhodanobacter thiooxydans]|uniref:Fibronectin type-III domain-containing protein n=2 Tax=Rhodanobacter thiooxydans TaxID=416169 RepID=A0A154QL27_9GAMM|nr:hypothetical protein [Rhodanobacter thiooxydans]EIL97953.1 hypothetical protein UUA_13380 [Rhodanobacter thiooxydans LCS2]KZC24860.1 hypothetical protein RHOFW104T7_06615 [Rhodanobacter thiooxydans]